MHHHENFITASQEGGKRFFPNRNTDIQSVIKSSNEKESLPLNLPRSLETKDIPGGQPGTLQSRVVKNKEIAKKLIEEQQSKGRRKGEKNESIRMGNRAGGEIERGAKRRSKEEEGRRRIRKGGGVEIEG